MVALPYEPTFQSSEQFSTRILRSDFGDGYSQRAADGLNAIRRSWNLTFNNLTATEAEALVQFFIARGGTDIIDWQPVGYGVSKKFTCESWTRTPIAGGYATVSANLKEEFDL